MGQVVSTGQALLAVVDLDDVWVVANYKETELTHVRPGQRATVDRYGNLIIGGPRGTRGAPREHASILGSRTGRPRRRALGARRGTRE